MSVGDDFRNFCSSLTVNNRNSIGRRYHRITHRLNLDFWGQDSNTNHSFYVGARTDEALQFADLAIST